MIINSKNKEIGGEKKAQLEEFHFPGGGEYVPQTILAATREEAEAEYLRTRQPVTKVEPESSKQ